MNGDNILDYNEAQLRELRKHTMLMVFQKFALLLHRTVLQNAGQPRHSRSKANGNMLTRLENGWIASVCKGRESSTRTRCPAACSSVLASRVR